MMTPAADPNNAIQGTQNTPNCSSTNPVNTLVTPPPTQGGATMVTLGPNPNFNTRLAQNTNASPGTINQPGPINAAGLPSPANNTIIALPPLVPYCGPFSATCHRFLAVDDLAEAHCSCNIYMVLFHTPSMSPLDWATILSAQPPLLPMLAINKATNTAVILHCITKFYPPIGYHQGMHPAATPQLH